MRFLISAPAVLLALAVPLGVSAGYVDPDLNHVVTVTVTDSSCAPTSSAGFAPAKSSSELSSKSSYSVVNVGGSPDYVSAASTQTSDCWTSTYTISGNVVVTETFSGPSPTATAGLSSESVASDPSVSTTPASKATASVSSGLPTDVTYVTEVSTKGGSTQIESIQPSETVNSVQKETDATTAKSGVTEVKTSPLPTSTITLDRAITETITLSDTTYTTTVASTPSSSEDGVTYVTDISTAPGGYVTAYNPQETSTTNLVETVRRTFTSNSQVYTTTFLTTLGNATASASKYSNGTASAAATATGIASSSKLNATVPTFLINATVPTGIVNNNTFSSAFSTAVSTPLANVTSASNSSTGAVFTPIVSKNNTSSAAAVATSIVPKNSTSSDAVVPTSAFTKNGTSPNVARPTITTLPPGYAPSSAFNSTSDELTTTTTIWINTTITIYETSAGVTKPVSTLTTAIPKASASAIESSIRASPSSNAFSKSIATSSVSVNSASSAVAKASAVVSSSESSIQSRTTSGSSIPPVSSSLSSSARVTLSKQGPYSNGTYSS